MPKASAALRVSPPKRSSAVLIFAAVLVGVLDVAAAVVDVTGNLGDYAGLIGTMEECDEGAHDG